MTNATRNRILTRIESALTQGFYLRQMKEAKLSYHFTNDCYGGVCVVGGLGYDFEDKGPDGNLIESAPLCKLLGINMSELKALEAGFEGWPIAFPHGLGDNYDPDFHALGKFIANTYR